MFIFFRGLAWIFIAWRWGDWCNWKKYQPTILYIIVCDLLYNVLTYHYPLWEYSSGLFPNHVITNLYVQFVLYPSAILVYLGRFPQKGSKQILWVLLWVTLVDTAELVEKLMGQIHYHNGWNIWWSSAFDFILFPMLRVHFKKPLLAYGISVVMVITLLWLFHVPLGSMK